MMRLLAVLYIRMSSLKQEDSPESQRQQLKLLAAKLGVEIVGEYCDDGRPGDEHRPELERLIRDAQQPGRRWSVVLVDAQSRLARLSPAATIATVIYPLEQTGVVIHSRGGQITADDFAGFIQTGMTAHADREYVRTMSAAVLRGMVLGVKNGRFQGGRPPLGYDRDGEGRLVVVEPGASTVRRIFALAVSGMTPGKIASLLREEGDTQRKWVSSGVRSLLRCRTYLGRVVYGQQSQAKHNRVGVGGAVEKVDPTTKAGSKRPRATWVVSTVEHEALVDQDTFDRAAEVISNRRASKPRDPAAPRRVRGRSPLSGVLVCDGCGQPMVTEPLRKYTPGGRRDRVQSTRFYVCSTYHTYGREIGCGRNSISEGRAFRCILATIQKFVERPEWRERYAAEYTAVTARADQPDENIPLLEAELRKLKDKRTRLVDELADAPRENRGIINDRVVEISGLIERAQEQIQRLRDRPKTPPPSLEVIDATIATLVELAAVCAERGEEAVYKLAAGVKGMVDYVRLRFERRRVTKNYRGHLVGGEVGVRDLTGGITANPLADITASHFSWISRRFPICLAGSRELSFSHGTEHWLPLHGTRFMHALCGPAAALAVASIFYAYRAYLELQARRQRRLHERVAYMLWAVAQCGDD